MLVELLVVGAPVVGTSPLVVVLLPSPVLLPTGPSVPAITSSAHAGTDTSVAPASFKKSRRASFRGPSGWSSWSDIGPDFMGTSHHIAANSA
ncbi:hypothetical protein [Nannocystis pusilla]|uniref:hypothetical protein n=1 Tax=Nannocystis pusilla TaxID=889268 RepID=UPI003DA279A4